jgi:hypothetical protein
MVDISNEVAMVITSSAGVYKSTTPQGGEAVRPLTGAGGPMATGRSSCCERQAALDLLAVIPAPGVTKSRRILPPHTERIDA